MSSIAERALEFGARPDISARSVLVTIFGDTIVPAGGEVWLGDLIEFAAPFGFSERLVRTSMYRLDTEGWFDIERVGRRSRYRLSEGAREEFAAAEARIYRGTRPSYDGRWTLVFTGLGPIDPRCGREVRVELARLGFAEIAPGVSALWREASAEVSSLWARLGAERLVPTAVAQFDEVTSLCNSKELGRAFGLPAAAQRYAVFSEQYEWVDDVDHADLADREVFLLRTMVVHDYRRAVLSDPWLPTELLPPDWCQTRCKLAQVRRPDD